ncbi:hypothetical protein OHS33_39045 (plasmid) [Streptomyces sp. NBC_00536]|uniref:hypothetical protein n=1 Tax=Streptomyces sp. NBC_00536 TaxID=2975769 RepID=UPI002E800E52|nr:hypothetical protein [Streptomyces sp. NBC_00536]WUC84356.1 hypothetical protein OHS33_39045 [Streptomyces sp. NBC_00536]
MDTAERPTIRLIAGRRMQCKDIPDDTLRDAVRRTPQRWPLRPGTVPTRMSWDVHAELETVTGPIPDKLFLAKIRRLFAKGILGGCDCGCRGDFHLIEECRGIHRGYC